MRRILSITASAAIFLALTASGASAAEWQKPERIVESLELQKGMSVAMIGAGGSYLIEHLSKSIGETGKLFLVEGDPAVAESLAKLIRKPKLVNVAIIQTDSTAPRLGVPLDCLMIVNGFRYIGEPKRFLDAVRAQLEPQGRFVVIDFYRRPMKQGPPLAQRVASHRAKKRVEANGFRLVERFNILPYQYFFVFEPVRQRK